MIPQQTVPSIKNICLKLQEMCPGLSFTVSMDSGLVSFALHPDTKINPQVLITLHKCISELMPAGVDYEIETRVGTFTSQHTKKEIQDNKIRKDRNRRKPGAPWEF